MRKAPSHRPDGAIEFIEKEIRAYRYIVGRPYEIAKGLAERMHKRGVDVRKLLDEGVLKIIGQNH